MSVTRREKYITSSLYEFVFQTGFARLFVVLLLAMLFMQPLAPVFASTEGDASAAEPTTDPVTEALPLTSDADDSEPSPTPSEEIPHTVDSATSEPDTLLADVTQVASSTERFNSDDESETTESHPEHDTSSVTSSTSLPQTDDAVVLEEEQNNANEPTPPEALARADEYPVYAVTAADNQHNFERDDCVAVGDGSFYCAKPSTNATVLDDTFFAAPDSSGDLEIFATVDGRTTQVTFNDFDDAAPSYDPLSNTLVWHRLIGDRYHIISYDIDRQEEVQVSTGNENNMEPNRSGGTMVWQRWVDDNWEVILHDGRTVTRLTSSVFHDIAPAVRGDYVIWKTIREHDQVVSVFDLVTKRTTVIDDAEAGGRLTNPRMVIVYDAISENGDVVSVGYDPESGERVTLGSLPAEVPKNIPDAEQTGETRALIQNKASATEQEVTGDDSGSGGEPPTDGRLPLASTTEPALTASSSATLVVPALSHPTATSSGEILHQEEFTLVVPPVLTGAGAEQSDFEPEIPDLVIPPAEQIEVN